MTSLRHNNYEPWHIVTVTDEPSAGLHLDVKHPKDCDPDGEQCSTAFHVEHFGLNGELDDELDNEKGAPTTGTYRVRYWWDNYEPDGDGLEVEACAPDGYHADCGRRAADCDCRTVAVLGDVQAERARQIAKWGDQHREDETGGEIGYWAAQAEFAREACQAAESRGGASWRRVLAEEYFEALAESDPAKLRAELVQVAAVACAWIEDIDSRTAR